MNSLSHSKRVYMRSLATRRANLATSEAIENTIDICKSANYDLIIVETIARICFLWKLQSFADRSVPFQQIPDD